MIMALLLDLANIFGGFLLAIALLRWLPRVGDELGRFAARVAPFGWIVGVIALVAAGFYLIMHSVSGPHLFHFEVVGLGVGVALLWDRLTGRGAPGGGTGRAVPSETARAVAGETVRTGSLERDPTVPLETGRAGPVENVRGPVGVALLLAIFGIIAIVVGIQGLFTPD